MLGSQLYRLRIGVSDMTGCDWELRCQDWVVIVAL